MELKIISRIILIIFGTVLRIAFLSYKTKIPLFYVIAEKTSSQSQNNLMFIKFKDRLL
jgi:hypothetical protein